MARATKQATSSYNRAYYRQHRERMKAKSTAYRKANPEKAHEYGRRSQIRRYGIEPEQYDEMVRAQGGRCAICKKEPKPSCNHGGATLHIDHDHTTGTVRALLCKGCNICLGWYERNRETIEAIVKLGETDGEEASE